MGPWEIRLLWMYWIRLTMVEKARGYHIPPFKGFHRVTQGYPLLPMIFNVVMD